MILTAMILAPTISLAGFQVNPHVRAESMRYRSEPGPAEGALVKMFIRNESGGTLRMDGSTIDGRSGANLALAGEIAWRDMPDVWDRRDRSLPAGGLTVWTVNATRRGFWNQREIAVGVRGWLDPAEKTAKAAIGRPSAWFAAINVLGPDALSPREMVAWVRNEGPDLRLSNIRLWLPRPGLPNAFFPQPPRRVDLAVPRGEISPITIDVRGAPLGYVVVEAETDRGPLWAHLRLRVERFDIAAGWTGDDAQGRPALIHEPYLKLLQRWGANVSKEAATPPYADNPDLVRRFPIRFFGDNRPFEKFDNDAILDRVHGVEFLGEPQFDGTLPQDVHKALLPYARTRMATTLTLSDESTWRFYAGISDYPHYDAYRVTAPSSDEFRAYTRFGKPIGWGAPLETIADMCESLREMSRPAATAVWSQAAHNGWGVYEGRRRTAPTPAELRSQAYHALATRITSLYWFNPSLKSAAMWRDLLEPMERVGGEIALMAPVMAEGAAYCKERGPQGWELRSVAGRREALLFANDLDYRPDAATKTFVFGPPRTARFVFRLPAWLRSPRSVVRIDAGPPRAAQFAVTSNGVRIDDAASEAAIYVVSREPDLLERLAKEAAARNAANAALGFDPARNDADWAELKRLAGTP